MSKETGGPAFPSDIQGFGAHLGMTLRDYALIHAPEGEVECLIPDKLGDVAEFVGLPIDKYDGNKHYVLALAKARGLWADAMLAERNK